MADETHEDKIARLEKTVSDLVAIQGGMMTLFNRYLNITPEILTMVRAQGDAHLSLARFLCGIPAIGSATDRQKLLDVVSKAESMAEKLEAMIDRLRKNSNPPPPEGPAPAPEG